MGQGLSMGRMIRLRGTRRESTSRAGARRRSGAGMEKAVPRTKLDSPRILPELAPIGIAILFVIAREGGPCGIHGKGNLPRRIPWA